MLHPSSDSALKLRSVSRVIPVGSLEPPGAGAGAGAETVIDAVPVLPVDVDAVMVADPAALPVTTPEVLTDATLALLEIHVIACPVIATPF